jgi:hypothetical protein
MQNPQQKPTMSDRSEMIHDSYVMHIHNQKCSSCGHLERFNHFYEVWIHPSKTRLTGMKDLRPANSLKPKFSVTYIDLPPRPIPVCTECVKLIEREDHMIITANPAQWAETLKRKYAPAPSTPDKPVKTTPTLDQL